VNGEPLSPEEVDFIVGRCLANISASRIAQEIGRSYHAVRRCLAAAGLKPPEKPWVAPPGYYSRRQEERRMLPPKAKPKPRRCLCCGKTFPSAHAGNRLCPECRKRRSAIGLPDSFLFD
jgi:hypothetical protein